MEPLDPLNGDTPFTIPTQSEWVIWNSNGANFACGAHGDIRANGDSWGTIATVAHYIPLVTMTIHWRHWSQSEINKAGSGMFATATVVTMVQMATMAPLSLL